MERIVRLLQCPLNKKLATDNSEFNIHLNKLQNCHAAALALFCQAFDISLSLSCETVNKRRYNKIDYARAILTWVSYPPICLFESTEQPPILRGWVRLNSYQTQLLILIEDASSQSKKLQRCVQI